MLPYYGLRGRSVHKASRMKRKRNKKDNEIMNEQIRLGDVTGFDDAEIIDLDNDVYLVIDSDYDNTED